MKINEPNGLFTISDFSTQIPFHRLYKPNDQRLVAPVFDKSPGNATRLGVHYSALLAVTFLPTSYLFSISESRDYTLKVNNISLSPQSLFVCFPWFC